MKVQFLDSTTLRVYFTENAYETYTFNEWKNYGKHRVYVSCNNKQIGYIDMATKGFSNRNISTICATAISAYLDANN